MRRIATLAAAMRRRFKVWIAPWREVVRLRAENARLEAELDDERATIVVIGVPNRNTSGTRRG